SGKLYTQELSVSHFFCPDCGGQIKATPGKLHEREERKEEEEHPLASLKQGQSKDEEDTENDSLEPVTSRTWFTLKPRWCRCSTDARNRPGPGNPVGRIRIRTPLWSDARIEATQRKHPQLTFAAWYTAVERLHGHGCQTKRTAAGACSAK